MTPTRDKILNVLQLVSSKDAQYDLFCRAEARVEADSSGQERMSLAHELWRLWSQAVNVSRQPSSLHDLPADIEEALMRFTQFFHARLPLLPHRFESLMIDVHWQSVIAYAGVLLEQVAGSGQPSSTDG